MRLPAVTLCLLSVSAWGNPAAWHVNGEHGELWLLGSIHYLREQDYPLPPRIDELYRQADTLVMELDLDDLDLSAVQANFMEVGVLPASTTLRTVLAPRVYDLTESRAADLGMPLMLLEHLEPWLVALTLMDLGMNRLGYRASQGLEQYLLRRSVADGKEILGLESLGDQISIFDSLSWADQEALLLHTLTDLQAPEAAMSKLVADWRDGNLDELALELTVDFEEFPELRTAIVSARNQRWAVKLEELLRSNGRYLVVVGALHLVGEDSVIELLSARGLDVTSIREH
ncbi:MAG: TraB/GumN family protein [Gammaproteobacteria bacterium]|nr:TraB/GumN family protein [Gammaproteobacteria bacterium]